MHLDVNSEVYPMREGEKFSMALTSTINLDGTPDTGYFTQVNFYLFLFLNFFNVAYGVIPCLFVLYLYWKSVTCMKACTLWMECTVEKNSQVVLLAWELLSGILAQMAELEFSWNPIFWASILCLSRGLFFKKKKNCYFGFSSSFYMSWWNTNYVVDIVGQWECRAGLVCERTIGVWDGLRLRFWTTYGVVTLFFEIHSLFWLAWLLI